MFGQQFYFALIRKYVILFGTLFNDIKITRFDSTHNVQHTIDVPISYGPREKVLARLEGDSKLDKKVAIQLPRMTFEMTDFVYDGARKLRTTGRHVIAGSNTDILYQYNPVPYNFSFNLSMIAKNVDDAWQIVEGILPFFTPEYTMKAHLIPDMNESRDIAVVLERTSLSDLYEGNFEERRVLTADLGFVMRGWLYGPIHTGNNIITMANTNFFDSSAYSNIDDSIGQIVREDTVSYTPGQLANGSPTTNAALTIDRSLIAANSSYGYIRTSNTAP